MGDVYKGLTIRIGAETTQLKKALSQIKALSADSAKELRKMTQALNADPKNVKLINGKLELLGSTARATAESTMRLREQMAELGRTVMKVDDADMSVRQLAERTKDAHLEAERAAQAYNALNTRLEELHREYVQMAMDQKLVKKSNWFSKNTDLEDRLALLRKINGVTDENIAAYVRLHNEWERTSNLKTATQQVAAYKSLGFEIDQTRSKQSQLMAELVKMRAADPFSKMRAESEKARMEIELLDNSVESIRRELARVDNAFEQAPKDISLATEKLRLERDLIESLSQKQRTLNALLEASERKYGSITGSVRELSRAADEANITFKRAGEKLDGAKGKANELENELEQARQAMVKCEASAGKMSEEYENAARHVVEVKAKLKAVTKEVERQEAAFKEADRAAEMANAKKAQVELRGQIRETNTAIAEMQNRMRDYGKGMLPAMSSLRSLAYSLSYTVTPMITLAAYRSVEAANELDSAYRDMRKTVDGTEEQYERLREAAMEYSRTHATSAADLLEIEAAAGQLGIAVEHLDEFAAAVSNIGIATNVTTDDAALALGQLANIIHDLGDQGASGYERFSDVLVHLGNNFPTMEDQILNVTKRIGSMGSIVGMTTPQIMAWATAISSTGQKAEAAGTNVSKTMQMIEGAVASGGKKLDAFAEVARMSAQQFANAWENDPSYAMERFVAGLKHIDDTGGSVDATLTDLEIRSVRQKQTLEGLVQTYDVLTEALDKANEAWEGNGAAAIEAQEKTKGFSGALTLMKQNAQLMGIEMTETLTPAIQGMSGLFQDLTNTISGMPDAAKMGVMSLGLLAAAFGPVSTVVASVAQAYTSMHDSQRKALKVASEGLEEFRGQTVMTIEQTNKNAKAMKAAAREARLYSAAMGALKGLGITAAIAGITIAVSAAGAAIKNASDSRLTVATQEQERAVRALEEQYDLLAASGDTASYSMLKLKGEVDEARASFDASKRTIGQLSKELTDFNQHRAEVDETLGKEVRSAYESGGHLAGVVGQFEELTAAWDGSEASAARVDAYVAILNKSIDGLGLTFDTLTGKANMSFETLEASVESFTRQLEAQARLKKFQQDIEDMYDATSLGSDMFAEMQRNMQSFGFAISNIGGDAFQKLYGEMPSLELLNRQLEDGTYDAMQWGMAINNAFGGFWNTDKRDQMQQWLTNYVELWGNTGDNASEELTRMLTESRRLERQDELTRKAVAYMEAGFASAEEAALRYSDAEDSVVAEGERVVLNAKDVQAAFDKANAAALVEAQEAYQALCDKIELANFYGFKFSDVLAGTGITVEQFAGALTNTGTSFDDFSNNMMQAVQMVTDGRHKIEADTELTAASIIDTMVANSTAYVEWADNIVKLFEQVGTEAGYSYVKALMDEGPGNANLVQEFVDNIDAFNSAVETQTKSTGMTETAFTQLTTAAANAATNVGLSVASMQTDTEGAMTGVTTAMDTAATDVSSDVDEITESIDRIPDTMDSALVDSVDAIKTEVVGKLEEIDTAATEHATSMSGNYAQGVTDGTPTITTSVQGAVDGVSTTFSPLPTYAYTWGADMMTGMANGINANKYLVTNAVDGVASSVEARLGFSEPDVGPLHGFHKWMPDFLRGLARDIDRNAYLVRDSIARVAESMDLSRSPATGLRDKALTVDIAGQASNAVRQYQSTYDNRSSAVYNISIDGMSFNDDEQIKASALDLLVNLKRKAVMNVG